MKKRLLTGLLIPLLLVSCSHFHLFKSAESEFDSGLALFNQGKYEEAIPYFRYATEKDPKYTQAYLYLGRSYLNLGRYLEALPPLRAALEQAPQSMEKEVYKLLMDALIGAKILPDSNK